MPHYFFDIYDGEELVKDSQGTDLPDVHAARREAAQALTSMARDYIPDDGPSRDMAIEVRNNDGKHLFTISLSYRTEPPV